MYKTKLQEFCHQRNWGLPDYSCIKDGLDHNPQFRASVFVNGVSFVSPSVSKSHKEALNSAAKLAFLHLTSGEQHHQHKLQLQRYAQRKNHDPPTYSSKIVGPPHALLFQATVTIGGHSFESPGYLRNLKEAEHAAAKVALISLSVDVLQEFDARVYKNLLQEVTRKEGLTLPEYKTVSHGPPHEPTFFSTVEVRGDVFHGQGRKSKKLAELSAAKAAYLVFIKRQSNGDVEHTSSHSEGSEGDATENDDEDDDLFENSAVNLNLSSVANSPEEGQSSGATLAPPGLSSLSVTALETKKSAGVTGSYLLHNQIRVYTSIPDTTFPEGTVLLPIGDHKWVPVSLEFPNQKVN